MPAGETIHSLSYHAATRCLVALCEAGPGGGAGGGGSVAGGGHCLRVVHADSLQQVLSLRLAHGHYYTAGLVAALPCTSTDKLRAEQQQQYQQQALPKVQEGAAGSSASTTGGSCGSVEGVKEKEFIVLASYLLVDAGADPRVAAHAAGGQLQQGALSFMELVLNTEAPGGGSGSGTGSAAPERSGALTSNRYSLLLHGTCTIPAVANALAVARPSSHLVQEGHEQQQQEPKDNQPSVPSVADGKDSSGVVTGSTAATPLPSAPHLLAGCQDGVYLFSVHVDDGGSDGERAVNRALELVRQLDELALPLPQGAALEAAADAAAMLKGQGGGQRDVAAAGSGAGAGAGASGHDEDMGLAEDESGAEGGRSFAAVFCSAALLCVAYALRELESHRLTACAIAPAQSCLTCLKGRGWSTMTWSRTEHRRTRLMAMRRRRSAGRCYTMAVATRTMRKRTAWAKGTAAGVSCGRAGGACTPPPLGAVDLPPLVLLRRRELEGPCGCA